jgi:3-hydroxyisobutyrate dehydrogenase
MDYGQQANLDSIFVQIWIDLGHGVFRASHPFHTPVLATENEHGPDARTVVLRDASLDRRSLVCHTDFRSPKVGVLRIHPRVAWLFYDRDRNTQIRVRGHVSISHDDELAQARWKASAARSRACYHASLAPGTATDSPRAAQPLDSGFDNFAVIDCRVESIDWLYLQHAGHLRASYTWRDGRWHSTWLAP